MTPSSAKPAPELPAQGLVLLQPTASLYVAADESSGHAQYYPSMARGLAEADEPFPLFRLVSVTRDARGEQWAAVQTTWGDDRACTDGLQSLLDLDLRLFVRVSELATMTTRNVRIVYPDDTAVSFTAGVPLILVDDHLHAYDHGFDFAAPVPDDARGFAFEPSPHFATDGAVAWLDDVKHPGVRFGGVTRKQMPMLRAPETALPIYAHHAITADPANEELVTLRLDCTQYEVVVPKAAIVASDEAPGGLGMFGIGSGSAGSPLTQLTKGTKVYARKGELLGVVRTENIISVEEVAPAAGRRCFHYPLRTGDDAQGLDFCFTETDLVTQK